MRVVFQELLDRMLVEERLELPRKRVDCRIRTSILYDIWVKQYWRAVGRSRDVRGNVYLNAVGFVVSIASAVTSLAGMHDQLLDRKTTGQ